MLFGPHGDGEHGFLGETKEMQRISSLFLMVAVVLRYNAQLNDLLQISEYFLEMILREKMQTETKDEQFIEKV